MLQLNQPQTERPKTLVWDPKDSNQVAEAASEIERLTRLGFILKNMRRKMGEAALVPPPRDKDTILFRILSDNGDDRLLWDRKDPSQIKEARQKFDEYVKKGHTPYACRGDGKKGAKLDSFDPLNEEIIFVPKTTPS